MELPKKSKATYGAALKVRLEDIRGRARWRGTLLTFARLNGLSAAEIRTLEQRLAQDGAVTFPLPDRQPVTLCREPLSTSASRQRWAPGALRGVARWLGGQARALQG